MNTAKARWFAIAATILAMFWFSTGGKIEAQLHQKAPAREAVPAACYFFEPGHRGDADSFEEDAKEETVKHHAYVAALIRFYETWCRPNRSNAATKQKVADEMAVSWLQLWNEDVPYNASFHEEGGEDLLALMGTTHVLPTPMRGDPEFVKIWVGACKSSFFFVIFVPSTKADEYDVIMRLKLCGEVRDYLKREPSIEPILDMLYHAQFQLES